MDLTRAWLGKWTGWALWVGGWVGFAGVRLLCSLAVVVVVVVVVGGGWWWWWVVVVVGGGLQEYGFFEPGNPNDLRRHARPRAHT